MVGAHEEKWFVPHAGEVDVVAFVLPGPEVLVVDADALVSHPIAALDPSRPLFRVEVPADRTSAVALDAAGLQLALDRATVALAAELSRHNPVDRLAPLAAARVPLLALHGDQDRLVPLAENSALLHARYTALGGPMELLVVPGQGHSLWPGFFEDPRVLDFLLHHALKTP